MLISWTFPEWKWETEWFAIDRNSGHVLNRESQLPWRRGVFFLWYVRKNTPIHKSSLVTARQSFLSQIISTFFSCLCLVCSGNPLHSTALEDESRSESDHRRKATAGKQAGKRRGNEVQGMTETPKRPAQNMKASQESDVQAQKKSSKSRGNQKPAEKTDHAPKSQYLTMLFYFVYSWPQQPRLLWFSVIIKQSVFFILRRLQTISESRKNEGKKRAQSKVSDSTISDVTLASYLCVFVFVFCCHSFSL